MENKNSFTLIDEQNGNLAFKILPFQDRSFFDHIQRLNYFSVLLILEGDGIIKADYSEFNLRKDLLLCFAPYQPFLIQASSRLQGIALHFHSDFFCILKHHKEISCNGVLFNNAYSSPIVYLLEEERIEFLNLIESMKKEMVATQIAQYEAIISYLKLFLINASRIKVSQNPVQQTSVNELAEPMLVQKLKDSIELNFRAKRSLSEYANLLNINSRSLGTLSKKYFNKTITDLISERIIIEAKRELYLTSKSVKEIAYELGFSDEFYFSRFFKNTVDISPSNYRETVGFARAE